MVSSASLSICNASDEVGVISLAIEWTLAIGAFDEALWKGCSCKKGAPTAEKLVATGWCEY